MLFVDFVALVAIALLVATAIYGLVRAESEKYEHGQDTVSHAVTSAYNAGFDKGVAGNATNPDRGTPSAPPKLEWHWRGIAFEVGVGLFLLIAGAIVGMRYSPHSWVDQVRGQGTVATILPPNSSLVHVDKPNKKVTFDPPPAGVSWAVKTGRSFQLVEGNSFVYPDGTTELLAYYMRQIPPGASPPITIDLR